MNDLLPTATPKQARTEALRLLRPHRLAASGAVVTLTAATAIGLLTPLILGEMVDTVTSGGADIVSSIGTLTGALVAVAVLSSLLVGASEYLLAGVGERVVADLREEVVVRVLDLPQSDVERAGRGDLVSRITGDVRLVTQAVSQALPVFATAALTIALTLVGLGALDWRFAVAAVIAAPIQVRALRWYLTQSAPVYRQEREAEGARAQQLLDSLSNSDTVGSLRLAKPHLEQIESRSLTAVQLSLKTTRLRTRFFGRLNIAEFIGLSAVLITGFWLVKNGHATIGTATAAALFFHRLFDPVGAVLSVFDELQEGTIALARLVGVTLAPVPPLPADPREPVDSSASLEDVTFSYRPGDAPVLRDIDITIPAGTVTALVGATGAGKSTVAKLLAGTYGPTEGSVRIGTVPRDQLSRSTARTAVALVTQEVHVFAGTLAEDLRLAAPAATDADIASALDTVGASDWVGALPEGIETVVGDGGHRLTATQAQQLALARIELLNPPLLILDEATAEAGSAGARILDDAALALTRGRTSITVAHRLSQAVDADNILVMDGGRVVEQGSHDELVNLGGRYAQLWEAWSTPRR
ncbi:MAG: ABC transporter ATP-binding protein [Rhodococcus sp. (in: high G+C Gram-positive bacteria)]|uniref:ABC transporter ATP-binding protein n=1 Tax=Rhodococcus sp. TaxID=1831 RepID=UPI00120AC8EE|nr:ABC transporter ATP-binding protein [Rhodococcus sp. (in: high G+C Gram-positive bacteria)]RZL27143.1 MAG: ABC transporter ATP-binding protein [Rhodococcus sp. (in: high G+C Gram-positive bacteria)]